MSTIKPSLGALTAAALALPGLAKAETQTDLLYAHYAEADLPAGQSSTQSASERYTIDSLLFRTTIPLDSDALSVDATYETMSGASPWFITPASDGSGRPVQVMSGASIREERKALQLSYDMPVEPIDWKLSAGASLEDDYRSVNGGLEAEFRPAAGQYTLNAGVGYSYDQLNPTVGPSSQNVIDKADKDSLDAFVGVSWIVDQQTVVQTAVSYAHHEGYLSDPYKQSFIVDTATNVRDQRPGTRQEWSLSTRLRHYYAGLGAALHVDYRYFHDDWDVDAHTLEVSWNQVIAETWRLTPAVRWYSQSQAYFYAPYYATARNDGNASSDYRLSPYGALSLRLDLSKNLPDDWLIAGGVEHYDSGKQYALGKVDVANPGLVDFLVLTLRLGKRF